MESLVFTCPDTSLTIDSGISTNSQSLSAVRDLELELKCPHCAQRHRFPVKVDDFAFAEWTRAPSGLSFSID